MTRRRDDRQIGKFFRIGKKASPWAMPGALTIAAMPIACEAETAMKISRRDSAVDPAILFDPRSGTTTMGRPLGTAISRYAAGE